MVDGKHVGQHLDNETDEVLAQVAFADRIIINKGDLTSDEEKQALKKRLQSMNTMAEFYFATMADAPIPDLLDIGGFNVERAVDIKPNFLEPEYPFDAGTVWQLPAGDYLIKMSESHHDHHHEHDHHHDHGEGSGMSIVMTKVEPDSESDLNLLAEKVFVEFSAQAETISHGQSLSITDHHYQMQLEGREKYEFGFSLENPESIALFTGHPPAGLSLKLLAQDNSEISHQCKQSFHGDHSHDSKVTSTSVELPGVFNGEKLNAWLDEFLQENGPDVYRMKGVVGLAGQDYKFVFQGVHMIFGSQAAGEWGEETPFNRLVFIGKNLEEDYIQESLQACLA